MTLGRHVFLANRYCGMSDPMMDNKGFVLGGCFLGTFGIITHMDTVSTAQ